MHIKKTLKTVGILATTYYFGRVIEHGKWQRALGVQTRNQAQVKFNLPKKGV